ncbi:cyanobactin maturation protease PatG family protein [Methanosarcina barkeri]|uniref:cyanobactin maturation protease PatG family protein n=1 Tax=Methanosarcina barkeri TaxID=2208 RepID=UPI00373FDE90
MFLRMRLKKEWCWIPFKQKKSPICRPDSDCWDVKLTFFDPLHREEVARMVYRFTIDVSDVVPVSIGDLRSWSIY